MPFNTVCLSTLTNAVRLLLYVILTQTAIILVYLRGCLHEKTRTGASFIPT